MARPMPRKATSGTVWSSADYARHGYQPMIGLRLGGPGVPVEQSKAVYDWLKGQRSASDAVFELVSKKMKAESKKAWR